MTLIMCWFVSVRSVPTATRRGGTRAGRGTEPVSRLPAASAEVGNARTMAGLFMIGIPVLGGLVGGSIIQVAMRTYGLSLSNELVLRFRSWVSEAS